MTNLEFKTALQNGNVKVIFTDFNNKEYNHTILKVGNLQVTLFDNFLNKQYKLSFRINKEYKQYKLN